MAFKLTLEEASAVNTIKQIVREESERFMKGTSGKPVPGVSQKSLTRALKKAGEILEASIRAEAKRGFNRLEYKPAAWKHLVKLEARVVGNSVEVYGFLYFDDDTIKRKEERDQRDKKTGPGAMDKSRASSRPGKYGAPGDSKKYGMATRDGIVMLKSMPMQTEELWIHPAMAKNDFIHRGIAKAWPRAWREIQKAMS